MPAEEERLVRRIDSLFSLSVSLTFLPFFLSFFLLVFHRFQGYDSIRVHSEIGREKKGIEGVNALNALKCVIGARRGHPNIPIHATRSRALDTYSVHLVGTRKNDRINGEHRSDRVEEDETPISR